MQPIFKYPSPDKIKLVSPDELRASVLELALILAQTVGGSNSKNPDTSQEDEINNKEQSPA